MMQNSLDKLFDGLASALRDAVLPVVDDDYAHRQLTAAIELIANIATRVEWRRDHAADLVERVRQAMVDAGLDPPPATGDVIADRDAALAALAALAATGDVSDAIRDLLVWDLDQQLALLRTGAFS